VTIEDLLEHLAEAREKLSGDALVAAIFRNPAIPGELADALTHWPVASAEREDGSRQLNLVPDYEGSEGGLSIDVLVDRLGLMLPECAGYEVFVREPGKEVSEELWVWQDVPVIAWGVNAAEEAVGFLGWYEGCDEE
jgi:hypothetical protein